jgi:tetratricopeptide (TPR) repeat protein
MQLNKIKDAIIYFSNFIKARPKNIKGWKELIRCLYNAGFYEEALEQIYNAQKNTNNKPILSFYKVAVLFSLGKPKEALLLLQSAISTFPRFIKELIELNPSLLQNKHVIEILAKYKNKRYAK